MTERNYKDIADRFRDRIGVRHDAKAASELFSENTVVYEPAFPEPLKGRKTVEDVLSGWVRAFPDLTIETVTVLGAGDHMCWEWIIRGTHTGPLVGPEGEIPPTGRKVEFRGCEIYRLDDEGLIAEERIYYDPAKLMQQLGLG